MNEIANAKPRNGIGWIIVAAAALVLLVAVILHIRFGRQMARLVSDQFNQEQLSVARGIEKLVELSLGDIEKDLLQLAGRIAATHINPGDWAARLQPELERMGMAGVAEIRIWDRTDGTVAVHARGIPFQTAAEDTPIDVDSLLSVPGEIAITSPQVDGARITMFMLTPIDAGNTLFLGYNINLVWFLAPLLKDIRSGISGYAWIIDDQGRFLYHPYKNFIGQSAFEARQSTYPDLNFVAIDHIQKKEMLQGREGTGTYQSAWHRGLTGEITKLIAFCPVHIAERPRQFWSIAVVAPTHEIAHAVNLIGRGQLVLQGLMILVVVGAATALYLFEIRFSQRLEKLVTARTRALKRSEEKYRLLIESAEDFIFTLDTAARLKSVNSYTANFFGSNAEHLLDRHLSELFSEDVGQRNSKAVEKVFTTQRSVREEIEIRSVDPPVWLNANYMPLKNDAGEIHAVLCIARDITETKNLQQNLVATEKLAALGTLAAGVAHEINNPLGVILGFCDLLIRKQPPDSQGYEDLKIIERQGLHCKAIVDNLLSFARKREVSEESTDLKQCLEEIIQVARHGFERRMVTVRTELHRRIPPVQGDCRQLQQVFLNLMNNAVAAMPEGGELYVGMTLEKGSRRAAVKVSDTGFGIPEHHLDRIYEPFFTTKPEGEGTGLGLFVSYGIVSRFGGTLSCESRVAQPNAEKSGTTFTVKLPLGSKEAI